jgi:hypothetical protein
VYVIVFVPLEVTPLDPPVPNVPDEMVQRYVNPVRAVTDAVFEVPVVTVMLLVIDG